MDGNEGDVVAERFSVREGIERGELPSTATVMAVAAARSVEPDALPPLYDVVDPDALDDLFRSPAGTARDVRISFFYAGCDVTLEGDVVTVEPRAHRGSRTT